jgi:hypothetical protein
MDQATLTQTIQTARDLTENDRPQSGICCLCGQDCGEWSVTWQDFVCRECVRKRHWSKSDAD